MQLNTKALDTVTALRLGCACLLLCTPAMADSQTNAATTSVSAAPDSRFGLFNGLDHRSWYNQGDFPEPFLVDDSG